MPLTARHPTCTVRDGRQPRTQRSNLEPHVFRRNDTPRSIPMYLFALARRNELPALRYLYRFDFRAQSQKLARLTFAIRR